MQLRWPELCDVLLEVLDNVETPTAASWPRRRDERRPAVVTRWESSGAGPGEGQVPPPEPSAERVMALPKVLAALSPTEEGPRLP